MITMYELLGMVKDGKAPKKIKWEDTKYTLYTDEVTKLTYYQDDKCKYFFLNIKCLDDLNDEVEIIEEEKKIPEKLDIKDIYSCDDYQQIYINFKSTWNKINEIIDCLDYLKSKEDE